MSRKGRFSVLPWLITRITPGRSTTNSSFG